MRSFMKLFTGMLLAMLMMLVVQTVFAKGPAELSLSVDKTSVGPGESVTVVFSVNPPLPSNAWIGIIPSHLPHGSESTNDQNDLAYQYLQGRTMGSMTFTAPTKPGTYDLRFNNTDDNGVELAFVSFAVRGERGPTQSFEDRKTAPLVVSGSKGEATLSLEKREFSQGEKIRLFFTAPAHYAENAWIGIIPAHISHGSEAVNDQHDITYQYIQKRSSGEMTFTAPQPGRWDFRLNDTDNNGREITYVTFTVN
ncbi:MAG: hypothetical protein PHD54_07315 [Desulfuromonadaceae bacterium]|nr:hypothetical protein [Desulfuromonadaceae bacterium]